MSKYEFRDGYFWSGDNRFTCDEMESEANGLKEELEALRACEDCTSQEIEIKELKGILSYLESKGLVYKSIRGNILTDPYFEDDHIPDAGQKVGGGDCG